MLVVQEVVIKGALDVGVMREGRGDEAPGRALRPARVAARSVHRVAVRKVPGSQERLTGAGPVVTLVTFHRVILGASVVTAVVFHFAELGCVTETHVL